MNIILIGVIVLVVGAVVGGLIEYLLGLLLPQKPQTKNIIAILITILILAGFTVWISALGGELGDFGEIPQTPATSTPTSSSIPTISSTEIPEANDTEIPPTLIPTKQPTNTPHPKPTATIAKATYPTNNPGKWLLSLTNEGFVLEDNGTRNNLEASYEFQRVDRGDFYERYEQWGRLTSAFGEYSVDCSRLEALVAISQEVMTFSTDEGAEAAFDYWRNHPLELFESGIYYFDSEMDYRVDDSPGDQHLTISAPRSYEHCGQQIDLFQAITLFQRGNTIGVVFTIGRSAPDTRIGGFFYATDLDLNILADS